MNFTQDMFPKHNTKQLKRMYERFFLILHVLEINNLLQNCLLVKKEIEDYLKLHDNKNTICQKDSFQKKNYSFK